MASKAFLKRLRRRSREATCEIGNGTFRIVGAGLLILGAWSPLAKAVAKGIFDAIDPDAPEIEVELDETGEPVEEEKDFPN